MLDLVFMNAPELFSNIAECPLELSKDHIAPSFSVSLPNHSSQKGNSSILLLSRRLCWSKTSFGRD